jgi:hypothetical protein
MQRSSSKAPRVDLTNPASWIGRHRGVFCALVCASCLVGAAAAGWFGVEAQSQAQSQSSFPLPAIDLPKNAKAPPQAQTPPTAQTPSPTQAVQQQAAAPGVGAMTADADKPEIAQQCASLLRMARDLKAEVDKSTKDELSVSVVRKASEIEQMARKVRAGGTARADAKQPTPTP